MPDWIGSAFLAMLFLAPGYLWWVGKGEAFRRTAVKLLQFPVLALVLAGLARIGCGPMALCGSQDLAGPGQQASRLWSVLEAPDPGWLRPLLILGWLVVFAFLLPAVFGLVQDQVVRKREHRDNIHRGVR
jgi:hypothetical protein